MKSTRNTSARMAILNLLNHSSIALSHAEIQLSLDNLCNRVTIYRILDRLVEDDLIHKVVNVDGITKYASCHNLEVLNHNHNHIHFSCVKCNTVTCLENVKPQFIMPAHYKVMAINFTVSGLCPLCLAL